MPPIKQTANEARKVERQRRRAIVIMPAPRFVHGQSQAPILTADDARTLRPYFSGPYFTSFNTAPVDASSPYPCGHLPPSARIPAWSLYTATAHKHVRRECDLLRVLGFKVDLFYLSEAYGLLSEYAHIWPYEPFIEDYTPPHLARSFADILAPKTFSDSGDKADGESGQRFDYDLAFVALTARALCGVDFFYMGQYTFSRSVLYCDPALVPDDVYRFELVDTSGRGEITDPLDALWCGLRMEATLYLDRQEAEDRLLNVVQEQERKAAR